MDNVFPKVLQAIPIDDFKVHAYMNDGTIRCVDMRPLIDKGGVFEPLRAPDFFSGKLTVLNDTIAWDLSGRHDPSDCIDIDPFVVQDMPTVQ